MADFARLNKLADETISLVAGFTGYLRQRFTPNPALQTPH